MVLERVFFRHRFFGDSLLRVTRRITEYSLDIHRIQALPNLVHHSLCQKSHLVYRVQFSDEGAGA